MPIQTIHIDIPADILLNLYESENELKKDVQLSLALRLFCRQKLTLGKAAQLAGLSRLEFENFLTDSGVSISLLSLDEIINDSEKLN